MVVSCIPVGALKTWTDVDAGAIVAVGTEAGADVGSGAGLSSVFSTVDNLMVVAETRTFLEHLTQVTSVIASDHILNLLFDNNQLKSTQRCIIHKL